ncbi:magnesium/cobalt transporter CorA [Flavobacterium sp. CYK-55]|uniref:magnesium/cobalt transporter CorA n=1 Tax=Flavobacterium sp. CYK-55 TaxID=2835529 RepID=UPI001BCE8EB6|nr:magnesium/cobalt transporter CorA [Flavobacterium sp. CYK-55]MBS7787906.1 magnesium/cobalt transporter CorA [Flavobacterium sp. CYK-55]
MKKVQYDKVRKVQPEYFVYTGMHNSDPVDMQMFVYNDTGYEQYDHVSVDRIQKEIQDDNQLHDVKWLNIHGLHQVEKIQEIGQIIQLEPFVVSDILNVTRRPKMEELDEILFFSIKSILPDRDKKLRVEQLSFVLKDNLLVSFQEKKSDFFVHIRERIKTHSGIVRKKGNDYLLYLLLDAVMENFYITLEYYEGLIDVLVTESKTNENQDVLVRIEKTRDELNYLKRSLLPLRDALLNLKSEHSTNDIKAIAHSNHVFFARLHQKSLEILEQIEYDMNTLDSASNFYFSAQSHRMNQIMKLLTAVSVIFMPLTFIVGVYGMNFEFMPELHYKPAYFMVLGGMLMIVLGMVFYFKKKNWF